MAEYIDREALRTTYTKWRNIQAKIDDDYGYGLMDDVLRELNAQPAVDAVPVVRCRGCIYWQDNNGGYPHPECRWGNGETPDADDFCSYGERRDDNADR